MKLRTYLDQEGVTAMAFARRMGVAQSTVVRWLDGSIMPRLPMARCISAATNGLVSMEDLVTSEPAQQPASVSHPPASDETASVSRETCAVKS